MKTHAETSGVSKLATKEILRYLEEMGQGHNLDRPRDTLRGQENDAIGKGGVPEVDKSDKCLRENLVAAAARTPPEGMRSAENIKAIFMEALKGGHQHIANVKSGIFPSHPPVPVASADACEVVNT